LDHQAGVTQITKSIGVERAKAIRPQYDPQKARQRVFDRWGET
jgi:hypothetical protein